MGSSEIPRRLAASAARAVSAAASRRAIDVRIRRRSRAGVSVAACASTSRRTALTRACRAAPSPAGAPGSSGISSASTTRTWPNPHAPDATAGRASDSGPCSALSIATPEAAVTVETRRAQATSATTDSSSTTSGEPVVAADGRGRGPATATSAAVRRVISQPSCAVHARRRRIRSWSSRSAGSMLSSSRIASAPAGVPIASERRADVAGRDSAIGHAPVDMRITLLTGSDISNRRSSHR